MDKRTQRGRRALGGMVAVLAALAASACGPGAPSSGPATSLTTTLTSTPTATPTTPPPPTSGTPTPSKAPATTQPTSTTSAALPVTTFADPGYGAKVAVIQAPSGNIICDFAVDDSTAGCGVLSLIDADAGVKWWIDFAGARPERVFREDAPFSGNKNGSVQVVDYGTTVAIGRYACRSAETGMTCWSTRTGKGAHLARKGIDLVTMPVGDVRVEKASGGATTGRDRAGDYEALLSAPVPAALVPNKKAGRLTNGMYEEFDPEVGGEMVWLVNGDQDREWKKRVAFVDVAGDARKESVVLLGRTNGGVPWADGIVVYGADGTVVSSWDTSDAGGDPRGNCTFLRLTDSSVDVEIHGTDGSGSAAEQRGMSIYRLSKGSGTPTWKLVSRR